MPLTREELDELRAEAFADDIDITDRMLMWSADAARAYFESGGTQEPLGAMPPEVEVAIAAAPEAAPMVLPLSPGRSGPPSFKVIKIFADSHANTFITIEVGAGGAPLLAYPYTAGSAMGLRHADSITGYREALEGDLYGTRATDAIVLKFGQVDRDFVYYLKLADNPSLRFDDFAADSVRKYFSFVEDALASLPVTREQLHIMTPFATCVPDSHLRESLCTLPFMDATFKAAFREKLATMRLPSLQERTAHGATYAALLQAEAAKRGLRCIDIHTPMLDRSGVNALINSDQNHHLVDAHIPLLTPTLDAAFGGRHTRAKVPRSMPPPAANPSAAAERPEAALAWIQLFTGLRSGQPALKLAGHVVGSYREVERRFGPPLPLQFSTPRAAEPGFATWLVRFADLPLPPPVSPERTGSGESAAAARRPSAEESGAGPKPVAMVRLLGRYRNYDDSHAWLVECAAAALIDSVRAVMEPSSSKSRASRPAYDVPPAAFHQALGGGKRR